MATTVIIPARNEEKTIGAIVATFNKHPVTQGHVYVGLDADTHDSTRREVEDNGGVAIDTGQRGKGQVVRETMRLITYGRQYVSSRIILCDGDYTGLDKFHISQILSTTRGLVIGVPDWPETPVPTRVIHSWPRVSGFRCLPWSLVPDSAHGYLLETQINMNAIHARMAITTIFMNGLKSPFQWPLPEWRQAELTRDQKWGIDNGIL